MQLTASVYTCRESGPSPTGTPLVCPLTGEADQGRLQWTRRRRTEATVFVVDDDPRAAPDLVRGCSNRPGWAVDEFASAARLLLQRLAARARRLRVLDVRLPGLSGLALQEEMIRRGITLPVIMLTGFGEVAIAVRALQRGAFDFIEKPFGERADAGQRRARIELDADRRRRQARSVPG